MRSLKHHTTPKINVPEWFTFDSSFFDEIEPLLDSAKADDIPSELISDLREILGELKKIYSEAEAPQTTDMRREELRQDAFIQMLRFMSVIPASPEDDL